MHKIGKSGGFLGRLLGPLLKTGLPLIGNVLKPLAKSVLLPLGLTATASATDAGIQKKMFETGFRTLIICNEEMIYIKRNQVNFSVYGKDSKKKRVGRSAK